jgi:hypothetical protein
MPWPAASRSVPVLAVVPIVSAVDIVLLDPENCEEVKDTSLPTY